MQKTFPFHGADFPPDIHQNRLCCFIYSITKMADHGEGIKVGDKLEGFWIEIFIRLVAAPF
ncbi:hypothetical protein B5F86_08385 [Lachnoclostridium sp. An298]|nr:hypothetical protein B5F86_08385 [Lachnoclostridium sp. An298]